MVRQEHDKTHSVHQREREQDALRSDEEKEKQLRMWEEKVTEQRKEKTEAVIEIGAHTTRALSLSRTRTHTKKDSHEYGETEREQKGEQWRLPRRAGGTHLQKPRSTDGRLTPLL